MYEAGSSFEGNQTSPAGPVLRRQTITATVFVACIALWALGAVTYVSGLANSPMIILLDMCASPLLAFLTLLYLLLLLVRLRHARQRHTAAVEGRLRYTIAMIITLVAAVIVHFAVIGPPYRMFIRGFGHRMRMKADIATMRTWLASQPPADKDNSREIAPSDWPPCIAELRPVCVYRGESSLNLVWSSGFGHWAMIVGPAAARLPSNEFDVDPQEDYVLVVTEGVYVWHDIQ